MLDKNELEYFIINKIINRQNIILVGSKIKKSRILTSVSRRIKQRKELQIIPVLLDISKIDYIQNATAFWSLIHEQINIERLAKQLQRSTKLKALHNLDAVIKTINREKKLICLILDNVQESTIKFSNDSLTEFYSQLRVLCSTYSNLTGVLGSTIKASDLNKISQQHGSPLFNIYWEEPI